LRLRRNWESALLKRFSGKRERPLEVKPDIRFPFGDYRMTNSSAPGFKLQVAAEGSDEIQVKVTAGSLLLWSPPDYHVYNQGQELTIASGDTLYWSPVSESDKRTSECRIILTAFQNSRQAGRAVVEISADESFVYTGKLTETD